jgi:hypothetical protein
MRYQRGALSGKIFPLAFLHSHLMLMIFLQDIPIDTDIRQVKFVSFDIRKRYWFLFHDRILQVRYRKIILDVNGK